MPVLAASKGSPFIACRHEAYLSYLSAKAISTLCAESRLTGTEPTNLKHTNKENGYNQQMLHAYTKMLQCNPPLHTNSKHQ